MEGEVGWRKDVADSSQSGFTDEERIQLRLTSKMIVLNEFLPRPSGIAYGFDFGDDNSDMPQGEWVELYNNSDYSFDLAGWYIKDSLESDTNKIMITASNTAPAITTIAPKSWLVVYMNKAVLNNDGDNVRLFDNSNTLIDSHAYTGHDYCEIEPTPGEDNSDTTGGGTCGQVPPNKSYARIPDGIGYWVDPIPTPGRMNVLESENISAVSPILPQANEIMSTEIEEETTALEETATTTLETAATEAVATIETASSTETAATSEVIMVPETATAADETATITEEAAATPEETPVIEETPPATKEDPSVIEQTPAQEEPTPPPPLDPIETPAPAVDEN